MDSRQFYMLHDSGHKGMGSVAYGICLALRRMVQEAVYENGSVRCHAHCRLHIIHQALIMVHHFHAAPAQHIGGTHHHGITDSAGNLQGLFHRGRHTGFRHGNPQFIHHGPEQIPVLCQVNHFRRGAQNTHTVFLQIRRQVQGGLSAELGDDAHRLFLLINAQHIFQRQRLKIKLVRCVVIRGYRLRVAVHNDGLKAQLFQRHGSMDTAIVKLDSLPDTVGAAPKDHHLGFIGADRVFVRGIISGIVISAVRRAAHMNALPVLLHTQKYAPLPDLLFRHLQQPA